MKTIALLVTLLFSFNVHAFDSSWAVSEDRKSVSIHLSNPSADDYICDSLRATIRLGGVEYGDILGDLAIDLGTSYIKARDAIAFDAVGQSQIVNRKAGSEAYVLSANIDTSACRKAELADYCNFSEKDGAEKHLLNLLFKLSRKNNCELAEQELGTSINLSGQQVTSLKPLQYFKNLKRLKLSNNKIMNLSSLSELKYLEYLDVSQNPLSNIKPVLGLPSLKVLKANSTNVFYDEGIKLAISVSLKTVELRDTPYASKIRK
jgi:hypothetical protein